jgi:hypothetical protein
MNKINDKAVEKIFVTAMVFGLIVIVLQILTYTISGIINLIQ